MTAPLQQKRWILPVLVALLLAATALVRAGSASANQSHLPMVTAWAAADCDLVANPGDNLKSAVSSMGTGDVLCVRSGVYVIDEVIRIGSNSTNRTIIGYPGEPKPILDGQKRGPGGIFDPLIRVQGSDTIIAGLELRHSAGRGISVDQPARNVILRDLDVHDNWQAGIAVKGFTNTSGSNVIVNYVDNVVVEDSRVYNNVRKAQYGPVIYKAHRTGTGPTDWQFIPEETWDAPFWDGNDTGFADKTLTGISVKFGTGKSVAMIYATTGGSKTNYIDPEDSTTGQQVAYDGEDLLVYDETLGKWAKYFDGDALGLPTNNSIDAFTIGDEAPTCADCYPILFSLSKAVNVPGLGDVTPGTILRFTPTASPNSFNQLTAGTFSIAHSHTSLGLSASANVDAIGHTPDGRLVISTSGSFQGGDDQDLFVFDGSNWSLYFDSRSALIPYNPLNNAILASWLDEDGDLYISGDTSGGSALTLIEARDSTVRNNEVFGNFGEGIVADRNSESITIEDNVAYDNKHASIYLNSTNSPLVQRNLVYCSTDKRFWRKAANQDAKAGPGMIVRDEQFNNRVTIVSSNQVIINNIVVGCGINFGVYSQVSNGGLKDALVANNTFAEAQGDPLSGFQNMLLNSGAMVSNTDFINNIFLQTTGEVLRLQGAVDLSTASASKNIYSKAPNANWFPGEAGRIVADPLLVNSIIPPPNAPADASWYGPQDGSPVRDAGLTLAQVPDDHFGLVRDEMTDIGAIEFVGTRDPRGQITLTALADPADTGVLFNFTTSFSGAVQLGHGEQAVSGSIATGPHSITAAAKAGWTVTDASCDDGSALNAIDLDAGEAVNCQVTYTLDRGQIEVRVATTPAGASHSFPFNSSYGGNFSLADGQSDQSDPLLPGSYSVTQTSLPVGWTETAAACDDGSTPGAIDLDAGETVICTFEFAQDPGHIVIVKQTDADSADRFTFTPSYGSAFTLAGGESNDSGPLSAGAYSVAESAAPGWALDSTTCDDGSVPGNIQLAAGETVTCTFLNRQDQVVDPSPTGAMLYLSAKGGSEVDGILFDSGDILAHDLDNGTWSLYLDSSDIGLNKNMVGFVFMPDGDILFALNRNQSLPGVGQVTPYDVVAFTPSSLGPTTAGAFTMYFDGSDVGLSASAEKIDSLSLDENGRLLFSVTRRGKVPATGGGNLTVQDEDLFAFNATSLGANTAGTFEMYLDGSTIKGLGQENISGAHVDPATGDVYLTLLNGFNIDGVKGNARDIIRLQPAGNSYSVSMFWRGPNAGFPGVVDSFEIVP